MSRVQIVIDDTLEFDGDLNEWVSTPPDFIKDRIKPGMTPQPHMKGVLMAMTDAVLQDQAISINVKTWTDGWTMTVRKLNGKKRKLK
jgi:hypothetical protein